MKIGAIQQGNTCEFTVWAPHRDQVTLKICAPTEQLIPMERQAEGYWRISVPDLPPGCRYVYRLEGDTERPDPASHYQPETVHTASQVIDHHSFTWTDGPWSGIPLEQMIVYELHVGTFTPEGTFAAIIPRLPVLKDLGVNAIELLPVAQCPGGRNWGYDGVYPFAVQQAYGGPQGLKQLVNACHEIGIAVIMDVVYNHMGPEGNYLREFGPYFTDKYNTPWGSAINFDDGFSDGVREFFIQNALYWLDLYHIDGLRLDAVHAIYDMSAYPFLRELRDRVHQFSESSGHKRYLIAESDLNDVKIINPPERGGYGHDSQWCDDFHHAVHTLLTHEQEGYYIDYGQLADLEKAYREGYVISGQYSQTRQRRHGNSSIDRPGQQFVVCIQNHDQVGNRMLGDRLTHLVSFEGLKLGAAAMLLSPFVPMLFMGEEYGEDQPFQYFVSHGDPDLVEAVRQGRRREFESFSWQGEVPDPQSETTFHRSTLQWQTRLEGHHKILWDLYQTLIALRRSLSPLAALDKTCLASHRWDPEQTLWIHRWQGSAQVSYLFNFAQDRSAQVTPPFPPGSWRKILDTAEPKWQGPGATAPDTVDHPQMIPLPTLSCVLYQLT